ncbi:MAG: outer membrane beta-barrel protein [Parvibaculum sp.]|uniref:outer membrane beta-barrel protein n=1 Tax=Parvibaculum sp. TaxID=2024848 RepID=UPI002ABC365F|nr:outer membrane beta-barrel protein [Parvibaculum sp.]MDZ4381978.1 outer membrane beta-barrel protein [Parvibaculum sp.]
MKTASRILCAVGLALGLAGFANGAAAQSAGASGDANLYNQTAFQRGLYVGGGLGWGWADDDDDWTWRGMAGWRLNQYLAVQGFYADLADITVGGVSDDVDTYGAELLVSWPVTNTLAVYGKGGLHNYDEPGNNRELSWLGGGGAEFAVAENTSVRTEWTHYDMDSDSVDELSAALVFGF